MGSTQLLTGYGPVVCESPISINRGAILSEGGARNEVIIEMVQIAGNFDPHKIGENEILHRSVVIVYDAVLCCVHPLDSNQSRI